MSEEQEDFANRWDTWHREFETRRSRPYGFLSITSLHWLNDEPIHFDDVPGAWSCDASGVRVLLDSDEALTIGNVRITGRHDFVDVDERGLQAIYDDCLVEVCRRDGQFMIRPRDPNNPVRTNYNGTLAFPPRIEWSVLGTFRPYEEIHSVHVGASVEGLTQVYESQGEIEFEIADQALRLVAFVDEDPNELFIVFTDQTAGFTTYPACRFLSADSPDSEGHVVLDFNRATNPPCAYTEFATCPLPPAANHLSIAIEAGEKHSTASH